MVIIHVASVQFHSQMNDHRLSFRSLQILKKVLMLSSILQPNRIFNILFVQNGHNINEIKLNRHSTTCKRTREDS